jgi:hypothetical protein
VGIFSVGFKLDQICSNAEISIHVISTTPGRQPVGEVSANEG